MNIQPPTFSDPIASELWRDYFSKIERLCNALSKQQRQDVVLEIRAHLLESMLQDDRQDDLSRVKSAIQRLGDPQEFVPGWVETRLSLATEPGNGIRNLYRLFKINAGKGLQHLLTSLLFGFCYMLVFYMFIMALLKIIFPANIGFYTGPSGIPFIGFVDADQFTEHLGWWFIPIGLIVSGLLLAVLSWMLSRFYRR